MAFNINGLYIDGNISSILKYENNSSLKINYDFKIKYINNVKNIFFILA